MPTTPATDTTASPGRGDRLEAVFALSPFGFVLFDRHDTVTDASAAFTHLTGLAIAEVVGVSEPEFSRRLNARCLAGRDFCGVGRLRAAGATLASSASVAADYIEIAGAATRALEIGICAPARADGGYLLFFRDITQRIEAERAESQLLSSAAHALRTPMTSIYGYSELMRMPPFANAAQPDMTAAIYHNAGLMRTVINDFFDLARIRLLRRQDLQWTPLPMQDWLAASLATLQTPAGRAAPLIDAPAQPVWAHANGTYLAHALRHLLGNAWKFSPAGSAVHVGLTERLRSDGGADIGLRVTDHGVGMTPDQIASVGKPFFQGGTDGDIEGCGLGLSMVDAIVRLHRGRLEIVSPPGAGTRVTLWLPATDDLTVHTVQR